MTLPANPPRSVRVLRPIQAFLEVEAAGGIVLILAATVAVSWASSPWAPGYHHLFGTDLRVGVGGHRVHGSLEHWVNEGLMSLFFFVVGLEIKREWVSGELRDRRAAALPVVAALGGMVVPAAIYAAVNHGGAGQVGWGIPMATDIAFALGVVTLLGHRVPAPLKVFLLTLAIVDDIGAIVVIAVFYAGGVGWAWLAAAGAVAALVAALWRAGVRGRLVFVALGVALWVCTYRSGVHATIAGVVMAFLTPTEVGHSLEPRLHPWTTFVIVPLFALANAGVDVTGAGFSHPTAISVGVVVGLVVGKAAGISAGSWVAVRAGVARRPAGVRASQFVGIALLGGIGFTVSIFVSGLAFPAGGHLEQAKAGVLAGSVVAAVVGAAVLVLAAREDTGDVPGPTGQTRVMESPDTVTDAVRLLRAEGYHDDVELVDGELRWGPGGPTCAVEVAEVDRVYRFEGDSDPGDEMVVFAVRDPGTGALGVLASAFGPAADPAVLEQLVGLSRRHGDR